LVKTPVCKQLKYRVFYTTVGFDTAAAANPCRARRACCDRSKRLPVGARNPARKMVENTQDEENGKAATRVKMAEGLQRRQ
jgi:hypothetical protein